MRARFNKDLVEKLKDYEKFISTKEKLQEVLNEKITKETKLFVEIGMGKGDFISHMAYNDPENVYIGIEVCLPVLAIASKKIENFEKEKEVKLDNLILMSFDAINISDILGNYKVDKIYLNFSDPWPKKKHTKRRLTNEKFLNEYKKIMKKDAKIEFKTDNRGLFEYSLVSMQNFGLYFLEVYLDLHKEEVENVMTEYEEKFSKLGPIYKIVCEFK